MINISQNSIKGKINTDIYNSFKIIKKGFRDKDLIKFMLIFLMLIFLVLCLPWTQNIRSKGYMTTLQLEQRPQTIHSIISGRIEKWFVREGAFVKKGDTIIYISEIKDEYFDPQLLQRTEQQIKAKELSVRSYMEKVKSLDNQIDALIKTKQLKMDQTLNYVKQARLKILSDSIDLEAAITNLDIAKQQYKRMEKLYSDGLKSLTDLEARKLKLQETAAKKISLENKLLSSRNELINAIIEFTSIENQYDDKIGKAESEKYTAMSDMYNAENDVTKMQNQYMNYSMRSGLYYITAPQDGYITKAIRSGIGETIKTGDELISIMPSKYDLAVEMYIKPFDLPLIRKYQKVRFMFDGWPSIVFSGWPNVSYGTFGGKVVAIDNFISKNGQYRILVAPDENDIPWPTQLRVGSGAIGMALLNDVPIWYELWRQLNGFPPDYYKQYDMEAKLLEDKNDANSK